MKETHLSIELLALIDFHYHIGTVGIEWNVRRGKTTRKKEFLEVWQDLAFHQRCPLILKNHLIRNPYNMILHSNYECNENIFPIVTNIYD
jgi:hypothetical protein